MSTFNYSKLATLVPKGLQEEKEPGGQREAPVEAQKPKKTSPKTKNLKEGRSTIFRAKGQPTPKGGIQSPMAGPPAISTGEVQPVPTPLPVQKKEKKSGSKTATSRKPVHVTRHTIWLPHKISADLTAFCGGNGITMSEFVTQAVERMLESVDVNDFEMLASTGVDVLASTQKIGLPPLPDEPKNIIFDLFQTYTGKKPSPRDRRMAAPYQMTDPRIIEIAMVVTLEKKLRGTTAKHPIKSFSYFVPEIENTLTLQQNRDFPGTLEQYHRFVVNQWQKQIKPLRDEKWNLPEPPT